MFKPNYIISSFIATCLMKIEALTKEIESLPLTPMVLATLRETAALQSTYYSTKIEGNRLTKKEVEEAKARFSSGANSKDRCGSITPAYAANRSLVVSNAFFATAERRFSINVATAVTTRFN